MSEFTDYKVADITLAEWGRRELDIAEGDLLKVASRRGEFHARAWLTDRVAPGLIFGTASQALVTAPWPGTVRYADGPPTFLDQLDEALQRPRREAADDATLEDHHQDDQRHENDPGQVTTNRQEGTVVQVIPLDERYIGQTGFIVALFFSGIFFLAGNPADWFTAVSIAQAWDLVIRRAAMPMILAKS